MNYQDVIKKQEKALQTYFKDKEIDNKLGEWKSYIDTATNGRDEFWYNGNKIFTIEQINMNEYNFYWNN